MDCDSERGGSARESPRASWVELLSQEMSHHRFCVCRYEKGKEKLEEDEAAAASTMAVSASPHATHLGQKTIPYDGESFHLEYMDLDEFPAGEWHPRQPHPPGAEPAAAGG